MVIQAVYINEAQGGAQGTCSILRVPTENDRAEMLLLELHGGGSPPFVWLVDKIPKPRTATTALSFSPSTLF